MSAKDLGMGSGKEWSFEDQRDIVILGIFTPRASFQSSQQQFYSRLGKWTVLRSMFMCCGIDKTYGTDPIWRISDKSASIVEIDFT
ncbi:hypothetical protein Tco_0490533 [Tanacetum coccineum]